MKGGEEGGEGGEEEGGELGGKEVVEGKVGGGDREGEEKLEVAEILVGVFDYL